MKRIGIISFLLVWSFNYLLAGDNRDTCLDKSDLIIQSVKSFSDSLVKNKLDDNKYTVYVIHFYIDSKTKKEAFTIGYIFVSSMLKYVKPTHFFWVGEFPVLLNERDAKYFENFKKLNITKHEYSDEGLIKIAQKLFPNDLGITFTGSSSAYKVIIDKCNPQTTFFRINELPEEENIFMHVPKIGPGKRFLD